jgi:hypothetical protein
MDVFRKTRRGQESFREDSRPPFSVRATPAPIEVKHYDLATLLRFDALKAYLFRDTNSEQEGLILQSATRQNRASPITTLEGYPLKRAPAWLRSAR